MSEAAEPSPQKGWTIETYAAHNEALRQAEEKFQEERDRRYTEVGVEREKALKIKETADLAALSLARDIQIYKDEKANQLREQINSERGAYATKGDVVALAEKFDTALKPVTDYMSSQQGRSGGTSATWVTIAAVFGAVIAAGGLIFTVVALVLTRP